MELAKDREVTVVGLLLTQSPNCLSYNPPMVNVAALLMSDVLTL